MRGTIERLKNLQLNRVWYAIVHHSYYHHCYKHIFNIIEISLRIKISRSLLLCLFSPGRTGTICMGIKYRWISCAIDLYHQSHANLRLFRVIIYLLETQHHKMWLKWFWFNWYSTIILNLLQKNCVSFSTKLSPTKNFMILETENFYFFWSLFWL